MEERYEIREKIAQGGLGAVYRGFDTRMNREVAIKRIVAAHDPGLRDEASSQLAKEAGALASLQHPHIVTIYDVGSDDEGLYVVMEMIAGKTLDELVERAPLTWQDFRELALQTQEALIAAQELELIHRDLKPGNLMLTWLPSGKFQVKVVDFGLAQLAPDPLSQPAEQGDSVFGSIYFMAPEQFERKPIDVRIDMYAIGCVYYHALTGTHPFEGETGMQVMEAHLHHRVVPLQDVRSEIPLWVCDWIMWHMNRNPEDRPANAREALQVFLQNDAVPNPPLSSGPPPEPPAGALPPSGILHDTRLLGEAGSKSQTAPQPLSPPQGSKPSVYAAPAPTGPVVPPPDLDRPVTLTPAAPAPHRPVPRARPPAPVAHSFKPVKKGMSNRGKMMLAAVLALMCVGGAFAWLKYNANVEKTRLFSSLLARAADPALDKMELSGPELDVLLEGLLTRSGQQLQTIHRALLVAQATDGTNIDERIARFAVERPLLATGVRQSLFNEVLARRRQPVIVPILLAYAQRADDGPAVSAALKTVSPMLTESDAPQLLEILQFTPNAANRKTVEEELSLLVRGGRAPAEVVARLIPAYRSATNPMVREALLRLIRESGSPEGLELMKRLIKEGPDAEKSAAIGALGAWGNASGLPALIELLGEEGEGPLQQPLFDASFRALNDAPDALNAIVSEDLWRRLASHARTRLQNEKIIHSLSNRPQDPWSLPVIENIARNSTDPTLTAFAEQALQRLRPRPAEEPEISQ